jgi:small subunit ribosomal protein S4e
MGKRHTKRFNTSKQIQINKKEKKFFYNTRPGPHPKNYSLPLGHVIRDILELLHTGKETKKVIKMGMVLVDGKPKKDPRYPVGLMDVIEIPELGKSFRILPKMKRGLFPLEIPVKENSFKLCRIRNKTNIKGGNIQLNLHDGRNIIIPVKDPKNPKEDKYDTMGVLKIKIPSQEIVSYYPLKENSPIIVVSGKNLGMNGVVTKIEKRFGPNASIVKIKTDEEEIHETAFNYAFTLGNTKPAIKLFAE